MRTINCDFLVIGNGLAGLMSALHLSTHGQVLVAAKKKPSDSNTNWAQGGIASVTDPQDTLEAHIQDTLKTGRGLCDEDVVRSIIQAGPDRVRELEKLGVEFARKNDGSHQYDLGQEAGHSCRRILHAGDITGREVIDALLKKIDAHQQIMLQSDLMAIDLVTTGWLDVLGPNRCVGAYFLDRSKNEIIAIRAPHTVLATGGAGKVYLYTSNPDTATGDGLAMAWRAGLPIKNMEFVQFHPTCLFHSEAKSFLISEAVRGEGGRLVNAAGEPFMERYDKRGELAPRDVVARAIDYEIKKRGDPCVYLDTTHKRSEFLEERFPNIFSTCLSYGYNISKEPIPVVPAAHYFCGGVETDIHGATALEGLHACGEVACTGLHGANRLASNSLLEALVGAYSTAQSVIQHNDQTPRQQIDVPPWQDGDAVPSDEAVVLEHNWNEVRTCMWDYVGIVRTNKRLERAQHRIDNLSKEIRQYYLEYEVTADVLELRNTTAVAALIIRSAQLRKESRGLHYTLDYPELGEPASLHSTLIEDRPGGFP
ncbi:MAG: L-aspartate oxidase [Kiritimatiellae bacterium]|nr:L-aspartate oxidase [Kiritimatiellia bacterium]